MIDRDPLTPFRLTIREKKADAENTRRTSRQDQAELSYGGAMDLRAEIASAVSVALSPGPEQASGYAYLERIKNESGQTWQSCLDIFLAGSSGADGHGWTYTYPPEARMFGLQVVDDALQTRFDTLDSNEVLAIQGGLLDYVKREYVQGNAEGQLFCGSSVRGLGIGRTEWVRQAFSGVG